MKREELTKWEEAAIREHLRFYRDAEVIKLSSRLTAVKIKGQWVINEEVKKVTP